MQFTALFRLAFIKFLYKQDSKEIYVNKIIKTGLLTTALVTSLLSTGMLTSNSVAKAAPEDELNTIIHLPQQTTVVRVNLKGYVFGLRVMKANIVGGLTENSYSIRADLFTSGLGALLKKFQIWATTTGTIDENGLNPIQHIQQNLNKKNRRVEMNYGADTVDISIVPRLGSQGKPPASQAQRFESDDALSALLNMMMRGCRFTGEPCVGTISVFDSKQHYLLRMERIGNKYIKQRGFSGETIGCSVYYVPVSGFDPEDLPSAEEAATPVKIYLAKFDEAGLYIPVRMSYKISVLKAVIKARNIEITQH